MEKEGGRDAKWKEYDLDMDGERTEREERGKK